MADSTLNTAFEQFSKLQAESLANLKGNREAAADYFEKAARYQQAIVGDAVDFAIEQAQLVTTAENPSDYISRQVKAATSYGKVVAERAGEYVSLLSGAAKSAQGKGRRSAKKTAGTTG